MIDEAVSKLVTYALRTGLIQENETVWAVNTVLDALKLDSYTEPWKDWEDIHLAAVLDELCRIEAGQGVNDELLDTILHRETERALDEFEATGSWEECMISASRFAREHKRAVYHIYTSSHRLELEKHVDRISGEMMRSYVEAQAHGLRVSEADKKLVCDLYRFGITDIFYEWLENGMKEDLEAQIRRLSLLFTGNIRASLSRVQIPAES